MKDYDVVVIGAGNTGMFTAAALALSGVKPLVLEAHNLPGGMATSFVRGRFEFDATLHGHIEENMQDMIYNDLKLETEFPLYPLDVELVTVQKDGIHRDFYDYAKPIGPQLEAKYPGDGKTFDAILPVINDVRGGTIKVLNILGYLKNEKGEEAGVLDTLKYGCRILKDYPKFLGNALRHTDSIYKQYKVSPYLKSFLSMYWWYIGARLNDAPSLLSYATTDFAYPYAYVKDTAHSYMAELEKMIRDHGGEILYNTAVTSIVAENGKLKEIHTSHGDIIPAKHCVSTIDPKIAVGSLLKGADSFKKKWTPKKEKMKENFSFFMVYLGLDQSPEELGIKVPHIIINEELDPDDLWDDMADLNAPKTIGFMCPNLITEGVSEEGTSIVSISVPVMSSVMEGLSQKEYIRLKHDYAEKMIRKVEEYLQIDLRSHIEEIEVASPATFARYAGSKNGALGNYLSTWQFAMTRVETFFMNRGIKGLEFSGQFNGNIGYMNMNFGYRHGKKLAKRIRKEERK